LNAPHLGIQLDSFLSGDLAPSRGDRGRFGEAKEEQPDFIQRETGFLRPSQNGELAYSAQVVLVLALKSTLIRKIGK